MNDATVQAIESSAEQGLKVELLEQTFSALAPRGEQLVARFYEELFKRYPGVKPLFDNTDQKQQEQKLLAALQLVVNNLRNPEVLANALADLGKRHQGYGAVKDHYPAVVATLLDVMKEFAGEAWTDEVHEAWSEALNMVATIMLKAYEEQEDGSMSAEQTNDINELRKELQKMQVAVEGAQTAMIMIDRDFIVTFVNQQTRIMLEKYKEKFAAIWPGFEPGKILGSCIDMFHKDPSHQRRLLSSPNNLPYKTDIEVGDLKFSLTVSAQVDPDGNYVGNTLEWEDVTEVRITEREQARLQVAVDGAQTPMIMIDRDFMITYVNESTKALLLKYESVFAENWRGFEAKNVMGACIDMFHKNPAHQRKLLSDPNNMPYTTDIEIKDLKFNLVVTAQIDLNGNYIGNTLEWTDVTDLRQREDAQARLQIAVDGAQTPMIMIDRDFIIKYVNESTKALLQRHEEKFKEVWSGFDASKIVGTCIDTFHKNPAHQRQLLNNPDNLPYTTDIDINDLKFNLVVTAQTDLNGNYIGNTLEWTDVTEIRQREQAQARLQVAVDGAQTPMIMIDRDFIIKYVNESTKALLQTHAVKFKEVWPGFDASNIVGTCIDTFHKNPAHQRQLLNNPDNLPYTTDIDISDLKFNLVVTAQMDLDGNYIGNTLEWTDVTELRQREQAQARLQVAVDGAQTPMMMVDRDFIITYVNGTTMDLLRKHETTFRQVYGNFNADNILGTCIDTFHKNPAHQRRLLENPDNLPYKTEIKVGPLQFQLIVSAQKDLDGNYIGNTLEWEDITEQKNAETAIGEMIEGAGRGELDKRIDAENYQGFMKKLAEGVNQLVDAIVTPLQDSTRVMQALAEGDLSQEMRGEYAGEFAKMRDAVNTSTRNLANIVRENIRVMEALAEGDLTQEMQGEVVGEFTNIRDAVNISTKNLLNMVKQIRDAADNITNNAAEIANGNTDLSQRTEEQASSLEETASSMEELTSTVKQNADNSRQANQLASSARDQAEKGGEVVSRTVTAMGEINRSSKKIADIIGVIDEIAFQTNLLALNAAVEAARAGEQGRGFAVVASEVRNLAQRSAEAAKEIKVLINDSVEKVGDGTRLVDESGKMLEEIVNSVKKVSDIIAEITAASEEQASGLEQINKAIIEMDKMTQENAALVEESTAAGESMDEQAKGLSELMEFFNVGEGPSGQHSTATANERRGSQERPWKSGAQTNKRANVQKSKAKKAVAAGAADDDWEEL